MRQWRIDEAGEVSQKLGESLLLCAYNALSAYWKKERERERFIIIFFREY